MFGAVAGSSGIGGSFITSNNNSMLRVFRICFPFSSSSNSGEYRDDVNLIEFSESLQIF